MPGMEYVSVIQEALAANTRRQLLEVIDSLEGTSKCLVIDPTLSGPLGLVIDLSILKDHGVEKTCHLRYEPLDVPNRRIIYLARANVPNMKMIAEQIRQQMTEAHKRNEYFICMVPHRTAMCERVLEEEGVYDDMRVGDLDLGFIPVQRDVVSMEVPGAFQEYKCEKDKSVLFQVAKGLMEMQVFGGIIPEIKGKGTAAKNVADMMVKLREELGQDGEDNTKESEISELILIDREVDLVTPMLTQLTYSGLIDDIYSIKNGYVNIPGRLAPPQQGRMQMDTPGIVKVPLTDADTLFATLRDSSVYSLEEPLAHREKLLSATAFSDPNDMFQAQVKSPEMEELLKMDINEEKKRLQLHAAIASELKKLVVDTSFSRRLEVERAILRGSLSSEAAMECIDEMLFRKMPFTKVMRMICLVSLLYGGIRKQDHYKNELLQVYGYEYMFAIASLERAGLFRKAGGGVLSSMASTMASATHIDKALDKVHLRDSNKSHASQDWNLVRTRLNVTVEHEKPNDADENRPKDASFAYYSYVPITLRIIEQALFPPPGGWSSMADSLKPLPGPLVSLSQRTDASKDDKSKKRVVLVMFIGGVTRSELAVLRFLKDQTNKYKGEGEGGLEVVVGTTKVLNGDDLVQSLSERPKNRIREGGKEQGR